MLFRRGDGVYLVVFSRGIYLIRREHDVQHPVVRLARHALGGGQHLRAQAHADRRGPRDRRGVGRGVGAASGASVGTCAQQPQAAPSLAPQPLGSKTPPMAPHSAPLATQ